MACDGLIVVVVVDVGAVVPVDFFTVVVVLVVGVICGGSGV